jgi:hypothetical protein
MVSIVRLNYIRHTLNYFADYILMPMTFQDGCSTPTIELFLNFPS